MATSTPPCSPHNLPPQATLFAISNKIRRQVDEIEKTVAQSLGYCYAGMQPNMMQQLSQVLDKIKSLHMAIKEIDIVKSEVSDMVSHLKKIKREHADLIQEREVLLSQLVALNDGLEDDFKQDEHNTYGTADSQQKDATNKKPSAKKTATEAESDVHMDDLEEENDKMPEQKDTE